VLRDIPVEDRVANVSIEESELPCMKALGVQWNAEMFMFTFKLNPPRDVVYTNREFLRKLAMLFDLLQNSSTIHNYSQDGYAGDVFTGFRLG